MGSHRQAAAYLKKTTKAFGHSVVAGEISRHYPTERGLLYSSSRRRRSSASRSAYAYRSTC